MGQNLKRFFLTVCILLSFVLTTVLTTVGYMASILVTFGAYQFFLIGVCVGALTLATVGLIVEREQWNPYKTYCITVMVSVFLLTVVNCVIFRILGGEHFIQGLVKVVSVFLNMGSV